MTARLQGLLATIACALACGNAPAQPAASDYPARAVTFVVPASPGGIVDAVARLVAKRAGELWRVPVIVDNVSGADGVIGTRKAAVAPADGYTLLLQIPTLLLLKHSHPDMGFDPVAAFTPIAELGSTPSAIAVTSKLPVKTVAELVDYCNKAAAPCTWGTGQQLSSLYGARLFATVGLRNLLHVPYKSSAPMMTDVAGGHVLIGMASIGSPRPFHQAGTVRILAVNSERRFGQLPDVPTFREAGIDVPPRGSWVGLFAPNKTPAGVVAKLESTMRSLADDKTLAGAMFSIGAQPVFGTQPAFATALKDEQAYLDGLLKDYPLK